MARPTGVERAITAYEAMGTMTGSIDLAFGAGPMVFGLVAAVGGIPAAFLAGAALALVGAAGTVMALRRAQP